MQFQDLYKSVFAILRIDTRLQANNAAVVGSAFVINTNPLRLLTCNHVVSEGNDTNNAPITYSITKRSDPTADFDIRNVQISYLRVGSITHNPATDLAILEVDPATDRNVAALLKLDQTQALPISFDPAHRDPGSHVEWLSTGAIGDTSLTPRFFRGQVVTRYITDHTYKCPNPRQQQDTHVMQGIRLLEVDKLFIPGVSGSPIVHTDTGCAIAFVHGFQSFPILEAQTLIQGQAEITEQPQPAKTVTLKHSLPLITSLSLGIDLIAVELQLRPLV